MAGKKNKGKRNKYIFITVAAVVVFIAIAVVLAVKFGGKSGENTAELPSVYEINGDSAVSSYERSEESTEVSSLEVSTEQPAEESKEPVICDVEFFGKVYSSDVTEIDISGIQVEDVAELYEKLPMFFNLTYIDMCDCGLDNETMEKLTVDFPNVKFVWKVTMGLWTLRTDTVAFSTLKDGTITYRLTDEDCKVLKYCTDMVALDLGHNKVIDLSFLQYMPNLRILILVDNRQPYNDKEYINDISMLKYCPKLMYLEFFVGSVEDISVLEYLPELVDLNISYNPISDVTPLLNLPKIERLYLEHTNLTEEDYKLLKETYPDAYIIYHGQGSVDQGWRTHERYHAMIDMYHNNYVHELFMEK